MRGFVYIFCLISLFFSCTRNSETDSTITNAAKTYSEIVLANYEDALNDAMALKASITTFLERPSEANLLKARAAWLQSRESYGQTEAFRFYGGPIDTEGGPEGRLNAWPLDEAYIDYVASLRDGANIINSTDQFPEISADIIASLNEKGSETNVSSGYHAIEFLLWGQDLSDGPGAGNRPYTDYVLGAGGTHGNQSRRRTYLKEVVQLLISDLEILIDAWNEKPNNFRSAFLNDPKLSIQMVVSGLGKLSKGELAGERMFVAYDLRSKEDEHSCFSDNTHRDIVANAMGILNVFSGKYERFHSDSIVSGTSIYDVLAEQDEKLADDIKYTMEQSLAACMAIQAPFDQEIKNPEGRARIANAITLLQQQGDKLAKAAQTLKQNFGIAEM